MQIHETIARAFVREFDVPCTWQDFHGFARRSGLSGMAAAKKMRSLLVRVERLQAVQKANPPTSDAWQQASALLVPLFSALAQ